jgi:hypothetical protein
MKNVKVLCFITVLFSILSCTKDENHSTLADKVVGTYQGTTYYGSSQQPCLAVITKTSETIVEITTTMDGSSFSLVEIEVTDAGNNTYNLTHSEVNGYINGKVEGNTLTLMINSGVQTAIFIGSR